MAFSWLKSSSASLSPCLLPGQSGARARRRGVAVLSAALYSGISVAVPVPKVNLGQEIGQAPAPVCASGTMFGTATVGTRPAARGPAKVSGATLFTADLEVAGVLPPVGMVDVVRTA